MAAPLAVVWESHLVEWTVAQLGLKSVESKVVRMVYWKVGQLVVN